MINEPLSILDSPNFYKDFIEEEEINKIFSQNKEQINIINIQDELNIDDCYYLKKSESKQITPNKSIDNKPQNKNINDNSLLILDDLDDFESFYNKYTNDGKINDIIPMEDEYKNPCFSLNQEYDTKLVYSLVEDNQYIKIENDENNYKKKPKEKIFGIIKQKNNSEKNNKINQNLEKNHPNIKQKRQHKRRRHKIQIDTKDKCFPFKSGRIIDFSSNPLINVSLSLGLGNTNSTYVNSQDSSSSSKQDFNPPYENEVENIKNKENNNKNNGNNKEIFKENKSIEEISNYNETINNLTDNFLFKFTTKKYFVAPNGKKKKVKKKRKFKPDDIRKKIKARFHKTIKNIINENLKKAGSKELFDFLPQCFIGNVSKKTNAKCFELTYKELLSTNFLVELHKEDYRNSKVDQNKYKKNIRVLDYLENNPDICKRSGFDLIKDRKYKDILKIYFTSAQFENSLIKLKAEKESPEYIQEYINKARNYVNFYSNVKNTDDKKEMEENDEGEENEEDEKDNGEY